MKKLIITAMLFLPLFNSIAQEEDPSKAQYYIDGYYEIKDGQYILSDITSKGITFSLPNETWTQGSDNSTDDQIKFVFPYAQTTYEKGFTEEFKFWIWQERQHRWLNEVEVTNGNIVYVTNKFTCIMLLIDCSESIGSNFPTVQSSAKRFINMLYSTGNHDNIHIGIIGFNTNNNNEGYSPAPLTENNRIRMMNFIDNLHTANGTALYKAMDKAIDQIDAHVRILEKTDPDYFTKTEFESTHIISFTDGIDNTSRLPNTRNLSASDDWENNPYYIHIVNKLRSTLIKGHPISSHLVVVHNDEIRGLEKKFAELANGITSLNTNGEYQYYLVNNFSELGNEFGKIVSALTTRWHNLQLFIPQNRVGRVRWTLGPLVKQAQAPAPRPTAKKVSKKPYRSSIGVIVGSLNGFSNKSFAGKRFAIQVDFGLKPFLYEEYYSYYGYYGSYSGYNSEITGIIEADVNFLFEKDIKTSNVGGWYWFIGGGINLGLTLDSSEFKTGMNAMGGVEYIFSKVPITLQLDFRPGYGYIIDQDGFFDWALTFSARWHF